VGLPEEGIVGVLSTFEGRHSATGIAGAAVEKVRRVVKPKRMQLREGILRIVVDVEIKVVEVRKRSVKRYKVKVEVEV